MPTFHAEVHLEPTHRVFGYELVRPHRVRSRCRAASRRRARSNDGSWAPVRLQLFVKTQKARWSKMAPFVVACSIVFCFTVKVGIASHPEFSVVSELHDTDELLRPPRCILSAWSKWDEACSRPGQETSALRIYCDIL